MKKLYDEIKKINEMVTKKQKQEDFKDDMVRKTWEYQKKFGFERNTRKNSGLKQARDKDMNFGITKQMHLNMHSEVQIWH